MERGWLGWDGTARSGAGQEMLVRAAPWQERRWGGFGRGGAGWVGFGWDKVGRGGPVQERSKAGWIGQVAWLVWDRAVRNGVAWGWVRQDEVRWGRVGRVLKGRVGWAGRGGARKGNAWRKVVLNGVA